MLISFIIPALNEEKDISKILKEIRLLSYQKKEIIVADGGSHDRTVELAKLIADKVYDRQGAANKSVAENRNKGASLAKGEILFFIDSRVRIKKFDEFIEQSVKLFKKNNNLVGLTTKIRFNPDEEKLLDKNILGVINLGMILLNKIKIGTSMGWVQVVRTRVFWQIGGYDENLITSEDSDLFLRLNKIGQTVCLSNFTAYKSAKRYHQGGWLKAIWLWFINLIYYVVLKKSYSKKWEEPPK